MKLNAPYKEIPSIFAVLNPQESVNTIRVNKVFLGEGDANQMAKVSDSVNYQPGELTITLNHSSNPPIVFKESFIVTQPGAFANTQMVYVTSEKLATFGTYTLIVRNNRSGNTFIARADALDSVRADGRWLPLGAPFYPSPPGSDPTNKNYYVDYSDQNTINTLRFNANRAKIYQMVMRMHFYDSVSVSTSYPEGKIYRYADYAFSNLYEKDKGTGRDGFNGTLFSNFRGKDVFAAIGNSLAKMNLATTSFYGRKMYKVQYFIYSSTQEYMDYLEFAAPSLNISQSKPLYTNFDDKTALGIFTFRSRCSVTKSIANPFISEFQRNSATCGYNFYNADLSRNTCP